MLTLLDTVKADRIAADTFDLVSIPSPTGDTRALAERYEALLRDVGCKVVRYEFVPNNPTLVAVYGDERCAKTVLFNAHMDAIPLNHDPVIIKGGRVYGRGACDMKGSLACILEMIRVINESGVKLPVKIVIVNNSLHESPGGRGEDLYALFANVSITADAAIVTEGATTECTIAQLGSATFDITIQREGEPSHQLYTAQGTPHPITVAAEVIRILNELNAKLEQEYIEDIGYASYFIGSVNSGQFYNQFPNKANLIGVRRYSPQATFEEVEYEMRTALDRIAEAFHVRINLDLVKVRDGYRVDRDSPAIDALVKAIRKVRGLDPPLVGKKLVTDAGLIMKAIHAPTLCHGPNQLSAHGDIEYVEIKELELSVKVYLQFLIEFCELHKKGVNI